MFYHGYCDKQNRDYTVRLKSINATVYEDVKRRSIDGRLDCDYASRTGCCRKREDCSIIRNLNR